MSTAAPPHLSLSVFSSSLLPALFFLSHKLKACPVFAYYVLLLLISIYLPIVQLIITSNIDQPVVLSPKRLIKNMV